MKLEEIRKLCDEATPGPWAEHVCSDNDFHACGPEHEVFVSDSSESVAKASADARFIATARTILPKLLAVAEEARFLLQAEGFDADPEHPLTAAITALEAE